MTLIRPVKEHGTRAGYLAGCRCDPCSKAHRTYCKRYKVQREAGRVYDTNAQAVRDHLTKLLQTMSIGEVSRAAGVPTSTVRQVLIRSKVRPTTARGILGVNINRDTAQYVPALGTIRRVRALYTLGHTFKAIGADAGISDARIRILAIENPQQVQHNTANAIRDTYDRLQMVIPTADSPQARGGITAARNYARAHKWAPPMAWDDDDLDNPRSRPKTGDRRALLGIDHAVITRVLSGDVTRTNEDELAIVVPTLVARELTDGEIGRLTDSSPERVRRMRRVLGLAPGKVVAA